VSSPESLLNVQCNFKMHAICYHNIGNVWKNKIADNAIRTMANMSLTNVRSFYASVGMGRSH